jgi:hypothetical protein
MAPKIAVAEEQSPAARPMTGQALPALARIESQVQIVAKGRKYFFSFLQPVVGFAHRIYEPVKPEVQSEPQNQKYNMETTDQINDKANQSENLASAWSENAPKGGKTVFGRILKDGAKVPLFLGQTLINSLRDLGYNNTTSSICEHLDNAIQWGAKNVRIYFYQKGRRGEGEVDVLIIDDGKGMPPNVLKVAMSFGGSTVYNDRKGIGRYGMGMKTAALSMGPTLEVYSWQERNAFYNMTLDVEEIGADRSNLIELPDPTLVTELPSEIADILTEPMVWPKEPQTLLAEDREEL